MPPIYNISVKKVEENNMNKKLISDIFLIEIETLQELEKEAKESKITFKELIDRIDGRKFYFKKEGWTREGCSLFTKKRYYKLKKKGHALIEYKNFQNLYSASEK